MSVNLLADLDVSYGSLEFNWRHWVNRKVISTLALLCAIRSVSVDEKKFLNFYTNGLAGGSNYLILAKFVQHVDKIHFITAPVMSRYTGFNSMCVHKKTCIDRINSSKKNI